MAGNSRARRWVRRFLIGMLSLMLVMGPAVLLATLDSLSRIHEVHMPVIIAHSRADTLVPYSHAQRLFSAANDPKRLITFDSAADDGFGGHVNALFEQPQALKSALGGLLPAPAPANQS
jgi:fermentation-respiration switch protein FrsA (DUF1100 family)